MKVLCWPEPHPHQLNFVKNRQAPSKLTPVSVSSRNNRASFSNNSFLTTVFSGALWNLKLRHCSCLPSTWILLQEGGIHALPRSCAPNQADASDDLHPQLLRLSLRSGSGQVPASTRERLGVWSSIPARMKLLLKAEEEPSCCSPWNQLCSPGRDGTTPAETYKQQLPCKSTDISRLHHLGQLCSLGTDLTHFQRCLGTHPSSPGR